MGKGLLTRHGNIAIYIPNLIGYARIVCALAAFAVGRTHPQACLILYLIGFICDELDGRAARAFNQSSTFGAVLDMLTDRLSTAGLLVLLCLELSAYYMIFLLLIILDIFSHWLQMYSSVVAGDHSHKETHNSSWLVRQYYRHRLFMGFCCVACEVLYLSLYMLGWQSRTDHSVLGASQAKPEGRENTFFTTLAVVSFPGFVVKQFVNFAQIRAAVSALIILDLERDRKENTASKKN